MDIAIHWAPFRHLRGEVAARPAILVAAMAFDMLLPRVFLRVKAGQEPASTHSRGAQVARHCFGMPIAGHAQA